MTLHYDSMMLPATMKKPAIDLEAWRKEHVVEPSDDEFRLKLRDVLAQSSLSMRRLSAAMGRDPGYVAALLDPSRPSRARPTPADLLRASDATGIPFVELLAMLWGIERRRLADELARLGVGASFDAEMTSLTPADRGTVADYVSFLVARHPGGSGRGPDHPR
jgi:hypothetical protein